MVAIENGAKIPKIKVELPCDSSILLLGTYPKEMKSMSHRDASALSFFAALFVAASACKQPKHPLMDEWKKKI